MEENEIIEASATKEEAPEVNSKEAAVTEQEAENEAQTSAPEIAEEPDGEAGDGEELPEISAESFAKTLSNPMFAFFARGRSGSVEETVREFEKMITAGKQSLTEEMLMKMTPGAVESAGGGSALSERQRKIARDAGMSYREYYEIIRSIPTKTK